MGLIKKLILGALALCMCASSLFAQFDKPNYRAELGLTVSKVSAYGVAEPLVGFRATGQILLPFKRSDIMLVSGLTLTTKGETNQHFHLKYGATTNGKENLDMKLLYLQMPVEVAYRLQLHPDHKVFLATGPYLAYALYAKGKSLIKGVPDQNLFDLDGEKSPFRRTELGWGINVTYAYKQFSAKVGSELSLTGVMNTTPITAARLEGTSRHALAYLSFGYQF